MRRTLVVSAVLSLLLLAGATPAHAGLFGRAEPIRPQVSEKILAAKKAIIARDLVNARKLSFDIATINKSEQKAVQQLHEDLLLPHIHLANAHLKVGDLDAAAKAVLQTKRIVFDAYTVNRSELSVNLPVGHPRFQELMKKVAELESQSKPE
jgi:hypothetical protein